VSALEIAAALAKLVQGDEPLLMQPLKKSRERDEREPRTSHESRRGGSDKPHNEQRRSRRDFSKDIEMETFRIEVGHAHGVKAGNIVGAIANETGIDGDHIARIRIEEDFSTVELPAGMPKELLQELRKVRVVGQMLNISKFRRKKSRSF
jgi:ATP-dependent RNA helicase DeaD